MKKYLAIVLSVVFVLGLTATAFAIHAEIPAETQAVVAKGQTQLTLSGSVRVRGEVRNNTGDLDDDAGHTWSLYDERVRLGVDAKVSDQVSGNITFEVASLNKGDTYKWGDEAADGATGVYTEGNNKRGNVHLLEGWLQYKGPVGLKVGHMPIAFGNKLFFDHSKYGDDAIAIFKDISPAVHLTAYTIKLDELSSEANGNSRDADAYALSATYKGQAVSGSADLVWINDQNYTAPDDANLYNLGVRANGKIGPASIYGDIEYQMGSAEKACPGGKDCDFKGYAVMLGAKMALGGINLGLELGQGSGDDDATDDEIGTFVTSLSDGIPYIAFVYGPRTKTACGTTNTGICNTTYAKLSADGKSGALGYGASLIWLKATEDIVNGAGEKESDLGIEIDATIKYALAKNLNYWIEGGYFMPGDAYKISATKDADNAYAIRHGIELSF